VEGLALLARFIGEERLLADPEAAADLVALCARLPLALRVAAAYLTYHPHQDVADFARELRAGNRLGALRVDDEPGAVRNAFHLSYRRLTRATRRMFRLLGLVAGPDFPVGLAAALAGTTIEEASRLLDRLAGASLIDQHAPGRYALHDLLRVYAAERAETEDSGPARRAAVRRLLDYYVHTAHSAALLLNPHRDPISLLPATPGVAVAGLTDYQHALSWFATERPGLVAAVEQAAEAGFDAHTWQLAWTMWDFLDRRGHWHDWVRTHDAALAAAQRLGDVPGQAFAHRGLGRAYARLGRDGDAQHHYRRALALFEAAGDRTGQARTHLSLAGLFGSQAPRPEARSHAQRAADLFRAAGQQAGQARALNAIGWHHAQRGEFKQALDWCRRALDLQTRIGDRRGEAATWDSLGYAHHHLGQHGQATTCYRRSIDLLAELGDRALEAEVLTHLGDSHREAGEPDAARDAWRRALDLFEQLQHAGAEPVRARLRRAAC
jgi:tetratricopeptide (TPR) repeat protein